MKKFILNTQANLYFILILLIIIFSIISNNFLTIQNFINIGLSVSILGILAIGVSVIAISGNFIDLSVGSNMALSGYVMAVIITKLNLHEIFGIIGALFTGMVIGLVNAFIIQKLKVNSVITTLATMALVRGIVYLLSGGISISIHGGENPIFKWLGTGIIYKVPASVIIFIAISIIFWVFYSKTVVGRNIYAIGNSKVAAGLLGINKDKYIYISFIISGLIAGFCGILLTARIEIISAGFASGVAIIGIAMLVLGGITLYGGRGNILGLVLGILFIGILWNGVNLIQLNPYWKNSITGMALLLAILLDSFLNKNQ